MTEIEKERIIILFYKYLKGEIELSIMEKDMLIQQIDFFFDISKEVEFYNPFT